jgi:hypothetical protein
VVRTATVHTVIWAATHVHPLKAASSDCPDPPRKTYCVLIGLRVDTLLLGNLQPTTKLTLQAFAEFILLIQCVPKVALPRLFSPSMESPLYCNQPPIEGGNDVQLQKLFELSYTKFSVHITSLQHRFAYKSSVTLEHVQSLFGHSGFGHHRQCMLLFYMNELVCLTVDSINSAVHESVDCQLF